MENLTVQNNHKKYIIWCDKKYKETKNKSWLTQSKVKHLRYKEIGGTLTVKEILKENN